MRKVESCIILFLLSPVFAFAVSDAPKGLWTWIGIAGSVGLLLFVMAMMYRDIRADKKSRPKHVNDNFCSYNTLYSKAFRPSFYTEYVNTMKSREGICGFCSILEHFILPARVFVGTLMFSQHQYIPLGIYFVLQFLPGSLLISIGLIVYFYVIKSWFCLAAITLLVLFGFFNNELIRRNLKKMTMSSKVCINPFDGQRIYECLILSECLIIILSVIFPAYWIIFAIVLVTSFGIQFLFYWENFHPRWKGISKSLQYRFNSIASRVAIEFQEEDIDVYSFALSDLLESAYPFQSSDFRFNKYFAYTDKLIYFSDKDALVALFHEIMPSEWYTESFIEEIGELIKKDEIMKKHFLIGEIILDALGEKARSEYILYCISSLVIHEYGTK